MVKYDSLDTAVVVIDPQNDVLSPSGKNRAVLQASVTENGTVEHPVEIFTVAKAHGFAVFISPHYFYPTDHNGSSMAHSIR
jgi:nicotinamidase-related amidase